MTQRIATILIGRNEGERLLACLASVPKELGEVVYVDSGSTDGSIAAAISAGAHVVELNPSVPFTAARARNAGVAALTEKHTFLQFVDGDCTLNPDWIPTAITFLRDHTDVAVVCGRRRERFPEASVYNRMCDKEWDTPIGQVKACGGDSMMRYDAFEAVGGFNPSLIAGEEPELCVRLRAERWKIWRIDAEMTLHDAAMTQFSQYWRRSRRGGHAYAEGAALHGAPPERHSVAGTRRALIWGLCIPVASLSATLLFGPWGLGILLVYPLQITRISLRDGGTRFAWCRAFLFSVARFAESWGILEYYLKTRRGTGGRLIEYK